MKEIKSCLLALIGSALLLAALGFNGCSPLERAQRNLTEGQSLTPEQIAAYDAAGISLFICLQVNGPPPGGSGTIITAPKSLPNLAMPNWGSDCHPLPAK